MRTFKWDPWFDPEEETKIAIAWISFPSLPPNYFVKEAVFSLASAVGKPLQVDMATTNKTRPSCESEEQSSDKEQEENSKEDQRKNKELNNAKNSRSGNKGSNADTMKGKEAVDKVQPPEVNDNDGFKEKKGKQRNKRHFHRDEDIVDLTDMQKSSDGRMVEAKVSEAANQIVTVQQIVNTNDKGKEKQMEESNQVERISAKAWIEQNFGKQLNDKGEILSQQVSKMNTNTTVRQEKEHESEEIGDTLIHKNLEKGMEEDKSGEVLQEDAAQDEGLEENEEKEKDAEQDETPISDQGLEENEEKEGKEVTRPPSNKAVNLPVEQVESAHHEKQDEAHVDLNSQDEEDLTQNIDDIAQQGDLSPRSVQKLKQATNKQKPVRSTSIPAAGVSTRRSKNKTNNSQ
ncbi:uncharacterized protein LOC132043674 [Lycium ferocissimum]|uniref:uncharacterized protein LOC132043674 n=1 Tax=Lycium ferocissimum TaxID=112874 RepID=UPI002816177B|nr:uncharacterized protein LOC132043674 [Lycium ferocissimum]